MTIAGGRIAVLLTLCSLTSLLHPSRLLPADTEDYFPLAEGREWVYEARHSDYAEAGSIHITILPSGDLDEADVQIQRISINGVPSFRYITQDKEGIYALAYRLPGHDEPIAHPRPRQLIKYPLAQGASWEAETAETVSRQRIESLDAAVTVPAGTFLGCLLIREVITPRDPLTRLPRREVLRYYYPGVGLVKKATFIEGGVLLRDGRGSYSGHSEKNLTSFIR